MPKPLLKYKVEHPFVGVGFPNSDKKMPTEPVILEEEAIVKEVGLDTLIRDLRLEHGVHTRITITLYEQNWSA